jgi:ribosome maturation factor RimP
MIKTEEQPDQLRDSIEPVINGLGFQLVDLTHARQHGTLQVQCIICNSVPEKGIGLDDCTSVHRAILPRIELMEDLKNVNLQVSSPGIGRKIKKSREFRIFKNKKIKLMIDNNWLDAVISDTDEKGVYCIIDENEKYVLFSDIVKAKLD